MRTIWLILVITMFAVHSPTVHAQAEPHLEAQAKTLFDRGLAASDEERWADAAALFEQSRVLLERPSTVFNLLGALYRLGRYDESLVLAQRYLAISDPVADVARRHETEALKKVIENARANAASPPTVPGLNKPNAHASQSSFAPPAALDAPASSPDRDVTRRVGASLAGPSAGSDTVPDRAPAPNQRRRRALWITGSLIVAGAIATTLFLALSSSDDGTSACGADTTAGRCITF